MSAECFTCGHDVYDEPCAWCELRADRDSLRGLADDLIAERDGLAVALERLRAERDSLLVVLRRCDSVDGWCGEMPDDLREDIEAAIRRQDQGAGDA